MAVLLLLFLLLPLLLGCGKEAPVGGGEANQPGTLPSSSEGVPTDGLSSSAADPEDGSSGAQEITLRFESVDGVTVLEEKGIGSVTLAPGEKFLPGDKIEALLPAGQSYLALSVCEKTGEAILFLPEGSLTLTVPEEGKNFLPPALFHLSCSITARIPEEKELEVERNLARNPYDWADGSAQAFPHASSNNEYNRAEFGAHNVLDGCTDNKSHGNYPYQSWGAGETVKEGDWLLLDFGREVEADTLTLYLRADFSSGHDAYFSSLRVEFSDGSSKQIKPTRTSDGQSFSLGGVKTSYLKLTGFTTDKRRGVWAGFTEVEVYGNEILK